MGWELSRRVWSAPLAGFRRQGDAVKAPRGSGSDRASGAARTRRGSPRTDANPCQILARRTAERALATALPGCYPFSWAERARPFLANSTVLHREAVKTSCAPKGRASLSTVFHGWRPCAVLLQLVQELRRLKFPLKTRLVQMVALFPPPFLAVSTPVLVRFRAGFRLFIPLLYPFFPYFYSFLGWFCFLFFFSRGMVRGWFRLFHVAEFNAVYFRVDLAAVRFDKDQDEGGR